MKYYIDQNGLIDGSSPPSHNRVTAQQIRKVLPNLSFSEASDLTEHGFPFLETMPAPPAEELAEGNRWVKGPYEEYEPNKWHETWIQESIPVISEERVPTSITRLQARLQLIEEGKWSTIVDYFENVLGPQDPDDSPIVPVTDPFYWEKQLAFFDDAQDWKRADPIVELLGTSLLQMTSEQLDQMFIAASKK